MNALKQPSPHAPDDDLNDVRWQNSVEKCAASIAEAGEVGDMVALLSDTWTAHAIRDALAGRTLSYIARQSLTTLLRRIDLTHGLVAAEYERRDEL